MIKFNNYKFGEIGKIVTGTTPSTKVKEYYDEDDYMFIGPSDLKNGKNIQYCEKSISNYAYEKYKDRFINEKSICIDCIGSDMGNVSITTQKCLTNQQINSITSIDKEFFNFEYIYYVCSMMKKYFHQIGGNGSTMPIINKTQFENIEIKVPELIYQNKIVNILKNFDKKIELNNQINNNLEDELDSLFYKYIWNNIENKRTNNFQHKILYDVFNVIDNRGKTPQLTDYSKFPIIDVKALSGEGRIINYNNCTKYVSEDVYNSFFRNGHPRKNDILISTVGSLAEMKLFIENKGTIAQNVVALRPKIDYPLYLYQYLKRIKNDLASYNIGSVQPSIKVTQFMKHDIWLVPKEECTEFEEIARTYTDKLNLISKENIILKQLRDTLLPKLMNGEIDLDKIEI